MTDSGSQESILEQHPSLRIDPRNIETHHKPHAKGGQADVTPATLKTATGLEMRVAVKKMRYDSQTDNDKFTKVWIASGYGSPCALRPPHSFCLLHAVLRL